MYNEKTPFESRMAKGVWDAMQKATREAITLICGKDLEICIAIATTTNGLHE